MTYKNKLVKFWANENVKFNWRSDLTCSGRLESLAKFITVN